MRETWSWHHNLSFPETDHDPCPSPRLLSLSLVPVDLANGYDVHSIAMPALPRVSLLLLSPVKSPHYAPCEHSRSIQHPLAEHRHRAAGKQVCIGQLQRVPDEGP